MKYAVVMEWWDGTVMVNGPYGLKEHANAACRHIAQEEAKEQDWPMQVRGHDDKLHCLIGEDGGDQIDVYVVEMGNPYNREQLA